MKYRSDRYGDPISILGYGCMRFTQTAGRIDLKKAEREIMAAVRAGVNYFDTAYTYPGNENALGRIVERNGIREKIKIATKLPHYMVKKPEDKEKYFTEQLKRLRTDYVDYYLMHMLNDVKSWERLKTLGMDRWLEQKKREGVIRQIGFSYHGNADMFCRLLDAYDWDFCQIQYNYLDEHSQAGVTGLKYAAEKGIPVIIMEPLRGGRLVKDLPKKAQALFAKYGKGRSPAEWAFRWLWNQPEVTCVLSGMNSMEMLRENVRTACDAEAGEFTARDFKLIAAARAAINEKMIVGCTGCRYCMPCPQNVDIPGTFAAYNRLAAGKWFEAEREYFMNTALRSDYTGAGNCIGCGKCERHCPQGIEIRKELAEAKDALEGIPYRIGRKLAPLVMKY